MNFFVLFFLKEIIDLSLICSRSLEKDGKAEPSFYRAQPRPVHIFEAQVGPGSLGLDFIITGNSSLSG